jgi:hypothetical protein
MPLIILGLLAAAGLAVVGYAKSGARSAQLKSTPVLNPSKPGTPVPSPVSQTGVTEIPLDSATSAIAKGSRNKKKKKK